MMADFKPSPKERGNVLLAQDWNSAMTEIVRLGEETLKRIGGTVQGDLIIKDGSVGIGTDTPSVPLEVNGAIKATQYEGDGSKLTGLDALSKSGGTVTGALTINDALTVKATVTAAGFVGDGSKLTGIAGGPWAVKDGALSYSGGSVGIGTDKPTQALEVNGTVKAVKFEGDGSGLTGISAAAPAESKWADVTDGIQYKAGKKVLVGAANSGASLQIINKNQDPSGDTLVIGRSEGSHLRLGYGSGYAWIQSATDKSLAINPLGGNLGVGTTDPQAALDVAGSGILMRQPVDPPAVSALLDKLPNGALAIGGPSGDSIAFYWKDENGNKLQLKLKGEALG